MVEKEPPQAKAENGSPSAPGIMPVPRPTGTDSPLVELSNAMVTLHRKHFGRGPAAARSVIADGMAICVMSDVFTQVERTLIEAGRADHVRETRLLHQETLGDRYKLVVATILGREVIAHLSQVHVDPDVALEVFLLAR